MRKHWLHWTRAQYATRVFPVVIVVFVLDYFVIPALSSSAARVTLSLIATILMFLAIYVTFTWVSAQDRRRRE